MRAPLFALVRCFTAVVTVWCLGCSSFEALLDHWSDGRPPGVATVDAEHGATERSVLEREASATVASDGIVAARVAAESDGDHAGEPGAIITASATSSISADAAVVQSHEAHACGCLSGHAATLQLVASGPEPTRTPHVPDVPVAQPTSIARAPLVPPPLA